MGDKKWLVLVPTKLEIEPVRRRFSRVTTANANLVLENCGIGLVAAAVRTAGLVAKHKPDNVMLLGIAGAYSPNLKIGAATTFGSVACHGIGFGEGKHFQTLSEAGWNHCDEDAAGDPIGDVLVLDRSSSGRRVAGPKVADIDRALLVSATSASSSETDVELRTAKYPTAVAEDMEGFAVAAACKLYGAPLHIVRGISNLAGDRDKANWRIDCAIESAAELAERLIQSAGS